MNDVAHAIVRETNGVVAPKQDISLLASQNCTSEVSPELRAAMLTT